MNEEEILLALASFYLSPDEYLSAKRFVVEYGDTRVTRFWILRAIDNALSKGDIDEAKAKNDYGLIGFSRDETCAIRQKAAPVHFSRS